MAQGALIVLQGTTLSVAGEAFDAFARSYHDRPACMYILATEGTRKYAELVKMAFLQRFEGEPPIVRIRVFERDDIRSRRDFEELLQFFRKVYDEMQERGCKPPVLVSITGGRKTMSAAAYIFFSHVGATVIDTRLSEAQLQMDRALNAQIAGMLSKMALEELFKDHTEEIAALVFRPAEIVYELPKLTVDILSSDTVYAEVLPSKEL